MCWFYTLFFDIMFVLLPLCGHIDTIFQNLRAKVIQFCDIRKHFVKKERQNFPFG